MRGSATHPTIHPSRLPPSRKWEAGTIGGAKVFLLPCARPAEELSAPGGRRSLNLAQLGILSPSQETKAESPGSSLEISAIS